MSELQKQIIDVKLSDADSESSGSLAVRIEASESAISIFPQRHGDFGSADGHGCPLFVEYYQGRLRVIVFPDINVEDPQIIDLSGAREDNRRDAKGMTILERAQRLTDFMAQPHPRTGEPHSFAEAAAEFEDDVPSFLRMLNIWRDRDTRLDDEGRANENRDSDR